METISVPTPAPEPPAAISPLGRVLGVFFSPKATFEDIARKPSWILPVILSTIFSIIAIVSLNQRMDWRGNISEKMDKDARVSQLSAEQREKQLDISTKVTVIVVYVVGVLAAVVSAVLLGAVMMLVYNLMSGAGATFLQSLGIAAHALLVNLVGTPIFLLVLFLKPPGTFDPENPLATNLAVFLPEETAKWLFTLCKSLDIFTIWTLILLAIGFAAVNPRKLKGGQPFAIAFTAWGAYVAVRVLWAFIFS